jgi:signal transduction histidine kinase/CheY-like chemotaxis protein/tetratricopeptide (TPR) repeat protein
MLNQVFPPSADEGYLRVPIPDINSLPLDPLLSSFQRDVRLEHLLSAPDHGSSSWLIAATETYMFLGQLVRAGDFAERAIRQAFFDQSVDHVCKALSMLVVINVHSGNLGAAEQLLSQLRQFSDSVQSQEAEGLYHETSGCLMLARGMDAAVNPLQCYEQAHICYRNSNSHVRLIRCYEGLASSHSYNGTYLPALETVEKGLELCAEYNDWRYGGRLLLAAANAFRDQGFRRNVYDLYDLAIQWLHTVTDEPYLLRAKLGRATLRVFDYVGLDVSSPASVEADFKQVLEEAQSTGAMTVAAKARLGLASLYKKAGDLHEAEVQGVLTARIANQFSPAWLPAIAKADINDTLNRRQRLSERMGESIEGVTDPFLIFDAVRKMDGECGTFINEFRNSAACQLLGMGSGEIPTLSEMMEKPAMQGLEQALFNAVNGREPYGDEVQISGQSGELRWFVRRIVPAGDGAVLTLRDSTESHKVEETLRAAANEAREAHLAKSEFLANVSHEIRTPIHGVLGLARALGDTQLTDEQQKFIHGIISSGDILLNVIGDVLDLSKIEARRMELILRPTAIRGLIENVIALHRAQAEQKGLTLEGFVSQDVPVAAELDESRVRQVLGNLVGNAIKFTREGYVRVTVAKENRRLAFEVSDSGIGISKDRIQTIFEAFRQGSHASDSYVGGTGLGLTISRRFVELMGGSIEVESDPSTGSRFRFDIPLHTAREDVRGIDRDDHTDLRRFAGKKVLLVEDNEVNVMIAEALLAKLNVEVTVAANGLEAIDQVSRNNFDVVLMDMRMPVMDGLAATEEIRRREEGTGLRLPIIALTAGALAEERANCFSSGMDDFVAKPFTFEVLKQAIGKWL